MERTVNAMRSEIAQTSQSHAHHHHVTPVRSSKPRLLPSTEITRICATGAIIVDRDISSVGEAVLTLKKLTMARTILEIVPVSAMSARAVA
jgi:hypothetical protein